MAYREKDPEKLYYSIGEVARMLQVNTSLLRFWEKEFDLEPKKNKKGNRLFTQQDIEKLKLIYHLVKERGFTLQGTRQKLREKPADISAEAEVVSRLQAIKSYLLELKDGL